MVGAGEKSDIEVLRNLHEESRVVLDHRIQLLRELDDKAMRDVRLAVIVLGILVSAGVAGRDVLSTLPPEVQTFLGLAVLILVLSIVVGIGVYMGSDVAFGIGHLHRIEAREYGYSEREWLDLLIDEYDEWINEMADINAKNAAWGSVVQFLFLVSLGFLLGSVLAIIF